MSWIYIIVFLVITVIYAGFSAALIFHLVKFGFLGNLNKIMLVIFVVVSVFLVVVAAQITFTPSPQTLSSIRELLQQK